MPMCGIDFDTASITWRANKVYLGNGSFRYKCAARGFSCRKPPMRKCIYCKFHSEQAAVADIQSYLLSTFETQTSAAGVAIKFIGGHPNDAYIENQYGINDVDAQKIPLYRHVKSNWPKEVKRKRLVRKCLAAILFKNKIPEWLNARVLANPIYDAFHSLAKSQKMLVMKLFKELTSINIGDVHEVITDVFALTQILMAPGSAQELGFVASSEHAWNLAKFMLSIETKAPVQMAYAPYTP